MCRARPPGAGGRWGGRGCRAPRGGPRCTAAAGRAVAPAERLARGTAAGSGASAALRKPATGGGGRKTKSSPDRGAVKRKTRRFRVAHPSSPGVLAHPRLSPDGELPPGRACQVPPSTVPPSARRDTQSAQAAPRCPSRGVLVRLYEGVCVFVCTCTCTCEAESSSAGCLLVSALRLPPFPPLPPPPSLVFFFFFSFLFQAHFVEFLPLSASAPRHFAGSSPSWAGAGAGAALLSAGGREEETVHKGASAEL